MEIKIEQKTKVVEETMTIGRIDKYYTWNNSEFTNNHRKDGVKKTVKYLWRSLDVLNYSPVIEKKTIGWGCHIVTPKDFREVLKGLKTPGYVFKKEDSDCKINLRRLTKVVRVYGESVSIETLTEKMEILLKIHKFLYGK